MQQKFSIAAGQVQPAKQICSPNYQTRPFNTAVDLLVVHNISLPPGQFGGGYIEQFFQNKLSVTEHSFFSEIKDLKVSAHLLIDRKGQVTQFVNLNDQAWHAGLSNFKGRSACNDFSIGIELEGTDYQDFEEIQYQVLAQLVVAIRHTYPDISLDNIKGHSDISPRRKTDPGPCFDWLHLQQLLSES